MPLIDIGSPDILYTLQTAGGLSTKHFGLRESARSWVTESASPEFIIQCDGKQYSSCDPEFRFVGHKSVKLERGTMVQRIRTQHDGLGIRVDLFVRFFPGTKVIEKWATATNIGKDPVAVQRLDAFCLKLPRGDHQLRYFTSGWAKEFSQVIQPLGGTVCLQSSSGRSSSQTHPWFALEHNSRGVMISTIAWSGNWIYRFEPKEDGTYLISGGLNPWEFTKKLKRSERFEGIHVITALGMPGDIDNAASELQRWGRKYWYPKNEFADRCPVEWNHWWPYEDGGINSNVFKQNVNVAAELGMEVCVLDAGWFGDEDASWYDVRGDWQDVNRKRFPEGVKELGDFVRSRGMKFGIWCEIEAVGEKAKLNETHSELLQMRDGKGLGAICLGNPDAVEWAFGILDGIITEYGVDWLKVDYNVDVGAGCNRTDHGHQSGDGLYEHYLGYYRLLTRIRQKHPQVMIENCSSGGLRIDLGLMKYASTAYLSDPDMPVHSLQLFWGATMMMAPSRCLHWVWSDTTGCVNPLKLKEGKIEPYKLDYYCRISMLNVFGLSQPLPELPKRIRERLIENIRFYKERVRPFVSKADMYHLTEQPRRDDYRGRLIGFEFLMPDKKEALVFVFRTPGRLIEKGLKLKALIPDKRYELHWEGREFGPCNMFGEELMIKDLDFRGLPEEGSAVLFLR